MSPPERLAPPEVFGPDDQPPSPEQGALFQAALGRFDVESLTAYATEPNHIKRLTQIALGLRGVLSNAEGVDLLTHIGGQLETYGELHITNYLSSLLGRAADLVIYPEQLSPVDGWSAAAETIRLENKSFAKGPARVFLRACGVRASVIAEAASVHLANISTPGWMIAKSFDDNPDWRASLRATIEPLLKPFELSPKSGEGALTIENQHWTMAVLLVETPLEDLLLRATAQQKVTIINDLLDRLHGADMSAFLRKRPGGLTGVERLQKFCSGHTFTAIARDEGVTYRAIRNTVERVLSLLRRSISEADRRTMSSFVSGLGPFELGGLQLREDEPWSKLPELPPLPKQRSDLLRSRT